MTAPSGRTLTALTLLTIALSLILWMLAPPHPEQARLGYRSSTFALQMVRNWPSLTIVLATPARAGYRLHTLIDFAFILAYGSLWIAMALRYGNRAYLKWIIGACILAAMVCDLNENLAILRVLGLDRGFTDEMALAIRGWALSKWLLLGAGWFLLSLALLTHRLMPLAVCYAFAAGIIATAFFTADAMIELAAPVLGVTLILQAIHCIRGSSPPR